jgi:hypothetical protein
MRRYILLRVMPKLLEMADRGEQTEDGLHKEAFIVCMRKT